MILLNFYLILLISKWFLWFLFDSFIFHFIRLISIWFFWTLFDSFNFYFAAVYVRVEHDLILLTWFNFNPSMDM